MCAHNTYRRHALKFRSCAYFRAAHSPMTRICAHMSNTETETDSKSLLRAPTGAPDPPPCVSRVLLRFCAPARERVICRKCNRSLRGAIDRAECDFGAIKKFFQARSDSLEALFEKKGSSRERENVVYRNKLQVLLLLLMADKRRK